MALSNTISKTPFGLMSEMKIQRYSRGAGYITLLAVLILASVAVAGKFHGNSVALSGSLIGLTAAAFFAIHLVPKIFGCYYNASQLSTNHAAHNFDEKDQGSRMCRKAGQKNETRIERAVGVITILAIAALGALAFRNILTNQRVVAGIALGTISGVFLLGEIGKVVNARKHHLFGISFSTTSKTIARDDKQIRAHLSAKAA